MLSAGAAGRLRWRSFAPTRFCGRAGSGHNGTRRRRLAARRSSKNAASTSSAVLPTSSTAAAWRTTLRGLAKINKRYLCGIVAFNLSLTMRKLTGVATPRQAAAAHAAFLVCYEACLRLGAALLRTLILETGTPALNLTFIPTRRPVPVFSRSRSAAPFFQQARRWANVEWWYHRRDQPPIGQETLSPLATHGLLGNSSLCTATRENTHCNSKHTHVRFDSIPQFDRPLKSHRCQRSL